MYLSFRELGKNHYISFLELFMPQVNTRTISLIPDFFLSHLRFIPVIENPASFHEPVKVGKITMLD